MHDAAEQWLRDQGWNSVVATAWVKGGVGVDFGGRIVNGDVHKLWPNTVWTIVDNAPDPLLVGDSSYILANAATWKPNRAYDIALCTEVFEHTKEWSSICRTAYAALLSGSPFVITCAGPGRPPHSGLEGGALRDEEWYYNIDPSKLGTVLYAIGFRDVRITFNPHERDVYGYAIKP